MEGIFNPTSFTELHMHLGASSTAHFLWELAHEQGIRLQEKDYWKFIDSVTIKKTISQVHYHGLFDLIQQIQSSPLAIEKSVHNAISHMYRKVGVRVIEIRFNPMRRNRNGEHDLDRIILAATHGMKKAQLEYPVKAGIIIEMDRRFTPRQNEILADKAIAFRKEGVVGLDLSGPTNNTFKVSDVVHPVIKAKKAGLGITIHTGETSDTKEMWEVVTLLKPDRIGHGVRCIRDKKLMDVLRENRIILEICPTSNIRLAILKGWNEVKDVFHTLKKNKVLFTVNSDSPELLLTDVRDELKRLIRHTIFTAQEALEISKFANKATFIHL